jgi:hypothetical protein
MMGIKELPEFASRKLNTKLIPFVAVVLLVHANSTIAQSTTLSPTFTKITTGSLVTDVGMFTGCAWGDFDNDGNLDVIVSNWANHTNLFYRNNGDGTFTRITGRDPVLDSGFHFGLAWGDFDNDGYLDLLALDGVGDTTPGKGVVYRNSGDGTFTSITGGAPFAKDYFAMGAWADYDNDGWLDFFTTAIPGTSQLLHNNLFRNNGDGTFTSILQGRIVTDVGSGAGCVWGDYDNDGFPDLFVANEIDGGLSFLYHNNHDGTFDRVTNSAWATDHGTSSCAAWGDYNNDGYLDLFVAGFTGPNRLYRNNGDGTCTRITSGPVLSNPSGAAIHGASWGDYDNDGYLDLFLANEFGNNALFHNNGDGTFSQIQTANLITEGGNKGACAWVDYDNDGFLDLFVTRGGDQGLQSNLLYHNNGNSNQWLKVKCEGTVSNRSAIGAKVRVLATIRGKAVWQLREITGGGGWNSVPLLAHFGLGDATNIDVMRIEWPSGAVQMMTNIAAKQSLTIVEPPRLDLTSGSAEDGLQFTLIGAVGHSYSVQSSANLAAWADAATVDSTNRATAIRLPVSPGTQHIFYRALMR